VEDAAFEAEYIVRTAAGLNRTSYFLDPEVPDVGAVEASLHRREAREPAAYITGAREFRGLNIEVGLGVLVPRPETEMLVDIALREAAALQHPSLADIGTGSGCVAVAMALECPAATVVATDVSAEALSYARRNASRHGAPVAFLQADLASPLRSCDVVLANLPYIPSFEIDLLEPEVSKWEPRVALDGGEDGFTLIRRLMADCATRLRPRLLALEVGFGMAATVAEIARLTGAVTEVLPDFAGIDRVVCCRWP
jgi:release factor glutamine methyltransferase